MVTNKALQKVRAEQIVRMKLAGISTPDIAEAHGLKDRRVKQIVAEARTDGTLDRVAEKMRVELSTSLLPKLQKQFEAILDVDAASLVKDAKGHQLKLNAANTLGKGLGVFRTRSESKNVNLNADFGIDEYIARRATRQEAVEADTAPAFDDPNTLDAEVVTAPDEADTETDIAAPAAALPDNIWPE
jgi:hypothetical protein